MIFTHHLNSSVLHWVLEPGSGELLGRCMSAKTSQHLICLCTEPPASLSLSVPIPTLCCSGSVEARSPRALGSKKIEGGLERNAQ